MTNDALTVPLAYRDWGGRGRVVLITHGLFGSARNWQRIGRALTDRFRVVGVDLRNHGASPWTTTVSYPDMAQDLLRLMDALDVERADLVGHSMGGKVAMVTALSAPERVRSVAVIDIAPVPYDHTREREIEAMRAVDLDTVTGRREADEVLARTIVNPDIRGFLLQNLDLLASPPRWRINLQTIAAEMAELTDFPPAATRFDGPALLLACGRSDYVTAAGEHVMGRLFTDLEVTFWPEASHWPHAERPEALAALLRAHLARLGSGV